MPLRFQRRIRIAPGVRLNISRSGIGGIIGRTGLRLGIGANRRKYFSIGWPGTGLSYRAFWGQRLKPKSLKVVAYILIAVVCMGVLVILATR
jgi:hypothetical protein